MFAEEPDHVVAYPVTIDELVADQEDMTAANGYAAAERVLRRVAVNPLPGHAEHLRSMVADALRGLERPHQVGPDEIRRLARAFIRVFDTVPVYRGMLGNDAHPQWLRLLRAKRFLGLPLRTDIPGGQLAAEVLANARRAFVEDQPEQYGLPAS